jgi:hypothetical protein
MKNVRNSLSFDNIVLDDAGYIELTGLQYNILFTEDNKPPFPVTTTKVPLLRVAGEAALYKDSPKSFMKQLVSRLLPDLQKMATLHGQTEARQYHEAELVKLLHQEVILETNSSEIRGVFEGCRKKWYEPEDMYHFKIRGDKPHEVTINIRLFCSGTAEMRAAEKADPPAYQNASVK